MADPDGGQRGDMTTSRQEILKTFTVTTASELVPLWTALLGDEGFGRRTLWLALLDATGKPAPVVVPIDDIPLSPSPADVESFGNLLAHLDGFGTPVLLLSRPGPSAVQEHDRRWAWALTPLAPRWPVHLATEDGSGGCAVTPLPSKDG